MGLFLDRPPFTMDPRALQSCNNVRIEQGRVRSDLIGWAPSTLPSVAAGLIYFSQFISSQNQRRLIGVTPTDLIRFDLTNTYMTPIYSVGFVSVNNGSTAVTGSGEMRWNTDIQFGDQVTASATASAGATAFFTNNSIVTTIGAGVTATDITAPGAINPGTYVVSLSQSGPPYKVTLSQSLVQAITSGDTVQLGSGVHLRNIARPGDQISFGTENNTSMTATWYTIQSVNSDNSLTLATPYVGTNLINAVYTIRQLLSNTVTAAAPFLPVCSSANFPAAGGFSFQSNYSAGAGDDEWYFTNGIDPIIVGYWNGPVSAQWSRSIPFKCNAVLQKQGILVCGGLTLPDGTQLNTSIASSDNGFPQQMAGGVAFQGFATDGPFIINRLSILGNSLMIYCSGQIGAAPSQSDDSGGCVTTASFVGYPTIWAFSDVIKTRGPLAGGAVAEFPDRHQFLSIDGEYRYNGLFVQVMNDHVWRETLKTVDLNRPSSIFTAIWPVTGDLIWALPMTTDPAGQLFASTALVEHYMEQANSYLFKPFTKRDFPFTSAMPYSQSGVVTWNSFSSQPAFYQNPYPWGSWGYNGLTAQFLACDLAGNIWTLYASNTQNSTPVLCTATWASRILPGMRSRGLLKRVYPLMEYQQAPIGPVNATVQLQDAPAGPILITDTQPFALNYPNTDIFFTTHYRRGRCASVTFSDSAGVGWVCDGYDWDFVPGGAR